MISRLYNYYLITRESLFYMPALICALYALICFGAFEMDYVYAKELQNIPLLFNGGIEDAQAIIRILLSSMITLTVLVISITMVVLNLSASQLGPRLIRIFMSDRQTKVYIGLFFGSIAACFVLIGLLHEAGSDADVPRLTVSLAFTLCFANLFVLLSYVQHIAHLSVADEIISKVHDELVASIKRLNGATHNEKTEPKESSWPKDFDDKAQEVFGSKNGYVQTMDYESVKNLASENGLRIEILFKPGSYLIRGLAVAKVYPENEATPEIEKALVGAIVYGAKRTGSQDIQYSVRHLVEIGLRALSPGINDNYTAITVLNKLSSALAELFEKEMSDRVYCNEKGKIILIGRTYDEADIISEAFSRIRTAGQTKPDILLHLIGLLGSLKKIAATKTQKTALDKELAHIKDYVDMHFKGTQDQEELKKVLA